MKNCDKPEDGDSLLGLDTPQIWSTELAFEQLRKIGKADTKRTCERRLHEISIVPIALTPDSLVDATGNKPISSVLQSQITQARSRRHLVLFAQLSTLPTGRPCLHFNDARGARYWFPLSCKVNRQAITGGLSQLQQYAGKEITIFPHSELVEYCCYLPPLNNIHINTLAYPASLNLSNQNRKPLDSKRHLPPHLKQLEAESIHIIREAVADAENPAILYSIGKDSSVLLHLASKAFYPAKPPLPLLHVDTRWKFQEMYFFRDHIARTSGMDLLVHINPEAIEKDINPFDHGSALHTDITKTEGLKQALNKHKFDVVFGGARRDEEKSRAKERIFSFRTAQHRWDPKNQRPEIWNLYNTRKSDGESLRVFPLSNWTELDVWQYIYHENIPVVPLYFAKERPVVVRDGMIMMVDDARMRLLPGEEIQARKIRFRTLGCYPLTGAVDSAAETVEDIILELLQSRSSERQGRAIDTDSTGSMEKKKQEGYF